MENLLKKMVVMELKIEEKVIFYVNNTTIVLPRPRHDFEQNFASLSPYLIVIYNCKEIVK